MPCFQFFSVLPLHSILCFFLTSLPDLFLSSALLNCCQSTIQIFNYTFSFEFYSSSIFLSIYYIAFYCFTFLRKIQDGFLYSRSTWFCFCLFSFLALCQISDSFLFSAANYIETYQPKMMLFFLKREFFPFFQIPSGSISLKLS